MDNVSHDSADSWRREHEEDSGSRSALSLILTGVALFVGVIVLFFLITSLSDAAL